MPQQTRLYGMENSIPVQISNLCISKCSSMCGGKEHSVTLTKTSTNYSTTHGEQPGIFDGPTRRGRRKTENNGTRGRTNDKRKRKGQQPWEEERRKHHENRLLEHKKGPAKMRTRTKNLVTSEKLCVMFLTETETISIWVWESVTCICDVLRP